MLISAMTALAPSAANLRAVSAPIPLPEPVTTTVLPENLIWLLSCLLGSMSA